MKIVATSDLHGYLPDIPECDLLLIAGDVCPVWNHDRQFQADWLRQEFRDWMQAQPARYTVWMAGNHDMVLQDWRNKPNKVLSVGGNYLDNSEIRLPDLDLKVYGSPYSNKVGNWAFMRKESDLAEIWDNIPRDVDILMVHGPVYGFGDFIPAKGYSAEKRGWVNLEHGEHIGSTTLLNRLTYEDWPNLKLVITGHIHEGHGHYKLINGVDLYSVAYTNEIYEPVNLPTVIEL